MRLDILKENGILSNEEVKFTIQDLIKEKDVQLNYILKRIGNK